MITYCPYCGADLTSPSEGRIGCYPCDFSEEVRVGSHRLDFSKAYVEPPKLPRGDVVLFVLFLAGVIGLCLIEIACLNWLNSGGTWQP